MKIKLLLIAFGLFGMSIASADHRNWHGHGSYYRQPQVHRHYGRSPPQSYRHSYYEPRRYNGTGSQHGPVNGSFRGNPGNGFNGNYPASTGFGAAPWSLGFGFGPASGKVFGGFGPRQGR